MRESEFSQQGVGDGVSCRVSEDTWGSVVTTEHGAEPAVVHDSAQWCRQTHSDHECRPIVTERQSSDGCGRNGEERWKWE